MSTWMINFEEWYEAVKYHADNYGVIYMLDHDDPMLQQFFDMSMEPDDFVLQVLLGEKEPDRDKDATD